MQLRIAVIVLAAWVCSSLGSAAAAPRARPGSTARIQRSEYSKPAPAPPTCSDEVLFSPRARRIAAALVRLELLELREARLERARAAVEGEISIPELLSDPAPPVPHMRIQGKSFQSP